MENNASSASPSSSSSSFSIVSRAKTAFHSAAAKAEKVIEDIKADLKSDRDNEGLWGSSRSSEYELGGADSADKNIDEAEKVIEDIKADLKSDRDNKGLWGSRRSLEYELGRADSADKNIDEVSEIELTLKEVATNISCRPIVPPSSVIKQLATALEIGKDLNSMNDLSTIDEDPSSFKEKAGLKFNVVKSLVLRDKEDKWIAKSDNEEFRPLIHILLNTEDINRRRRNMIDSDSLSVAYLSEDIRGAPPESFIVRLSEMIGEFKSLRKMALFWSRVIAELRRLWTEGQPIPHMPLDANPDLNSCLLHQQLQVINCCIGRKHRRDLANESLECIFKETSSCNKDSKNLSPSIAHYARISSGEYVLRLGAQHRSDDLTMLETGEPIYSPVTQEGPVLTEELIKETEEFVLRTGSCGAGCSQLLSDMQAFKAANPGCVLEDFIRWHSPPDWIDVKADNHDIGSPNQEGSSRRGRLSARMQKEGNLWRELWESAKPLPAIKQVPLYDEDLAVDGIFTAFEEIQPCELFEQLFVSTLCSGFIIAETNLVETKLYSLFNQCKDYVKATCQNGISTENLGDLCKVYETVETIVNHPKEALATMEQQEESISGESKSIFKKINLNFINKDKQFLRKKGSNDEKSKQKDEKKPEKKQHKELQESGATVANHPEESLITIEQREPLSGESKNIFKKINLNFINKDKQSLHKKASNDEKNEQKDDKQHMQQVLSNLFDRRTSLFSRKQPKSNQTPSSVPDSLDGSDWTFV